MIEITLNDAPEMIPAGTSVAELLSLKGIPVAGTAVALNGKVVPKASLANTILQKTDKVVIIRAAYGG